jgi:DNA-binding transcriptional regulator YbjK
MFKPEPLRHYTECKNIYDVVNKWVELWLPPLSNIEDGKKELISALSKITIPEMATEEEIQKIIDEYNGSLHGILAKALVGQIPKPEGKGLLQQKYVARCKELEAKVSEYRMALETLLELAMSCKRAGLKDMKIDGVIDIVTKGE